MNKYKLCIDCKYMFSEDEEICNNCVDKSRWVDIEENKW